MVLVRAYFPAKLYMPPEARIHKMSATSIKNYTILPSPFPLLSLSPFLSFLSSTSWTDPGILIGRVTWSGPSCHVTWSGPSYHVTWSGPSYHVTWSGPSGHVTLSGHFCRVTWSGSFCHVTWTWTSCPATCRVCRAIGRVCRDLGDPVSATCRDARGILSVSVTATTGELGRCDHVRYGRRRRRRHHGPSLLVA